jgi:hypothetical protein
MVEIRGTDRVKIKEVLHSIMEDRDIINAIKKEGEMDRPNFA